MPNAEENYCSVAATSRWSSRNGPSSWEPLHAVVPDVRPHPCSRSLDRSPLPNLRSSTGAKISPSVSASAALSLPGIRSHNRGNRRHSSLGAMAARLHTNPFGRNLHSTSDTIARKGEIALSDEHERNNFTDYCCSIATLTWRQHLRTVNLFPLDG